MCKTKSKTPWYKLPNTTILFTTNYAYAYDNFEVPVTVGEIKLDFPNEVWPTLTLADIKDFINCPN